MCKHGNDRPTETAYDQMSGALYAIMMPWPMYAPSLRRRRGLVVLVGLIRWHVEHRARAQDARLRAAFGHSVGALRSAHQAEVGTGVSIVILARSQKEMGSCTAEGGVTESLRTKRGRERKGRQNVTVCAICHGA